MTGNKVFCIDPADPDPEIIKRAGKIIKRSGIVIFPAQFLYGMAADALNERAVSKIYAIKKRKPEKPILILVKDVKQVKQFADHIPETAVKLMKAFWPGNITIILKAKKNLPKILTAQTGKIGVRIPSHPVAKALVNCLDCPITGTSANLSGSPGCHDPAQLDRSVVEQADMVLDSGILPGGTGSTIADATVSPVKILREGSITIDRINEILDKKAVLP